MAFASTPSRRAVSTRRRRRAPTRADRDYMDAMLKRVPLHRLASAEEVAATVAYLASPAAAAMTGQVLVLDGGLTAA
ncbi:MAG TPA: SDR family oxidoreductase [Xanthobacteraceae bacterium]|nr:SDR family oxidoreductase [Xanthobacteraceae bacterium]